MVSLWPWKGDGFSPAEFEKTLATLSTKITNTQAQLEQVRNSSRRIKLLWTLYLAFGYLVYAIVLTLVVGWQNLGPWEWTGMAGGPVVIYVVRTVANAYYSFRLDTLESRLKDRQAERTKTIQKLKDATKYDSTLELLEKYGGHLTGRTHLPPPPTANIQRPSTASGVPPNRQGQLPDSHLEPIPSSPPPHPIEEFAPNAGPLPPTYNQYEPHPGPPRWYDRILDLIAGLLTVKRPPGVKNVAELGAWKCMGCGTTNGEIDEGKKIMQQVLGSKKTFPDDSRSTDERDSDRSSDVVKVEQEGDDNTQSEAETRRNMQEFRAKRRDKKSQMVP
ncbi:hypothetical protein GQX73_g9342 [Xylaria multiplex]|uniref:Endoplasmic reticulum junction formation protein lunapark n=1 Tax=Xylaria multiplex TaxID=323545 RepID=A0A7C8MGT4_9PEZI|nr:hypothetical protein GQX73_g9342 [Xylaria multiplex]